MKALVLTYDGNHFLTEHMIKKYNKLWPDNPFIFYVPYQTYPYTLMSKFSCQIVPIMTSSSIMDTILTLLEQTNDKEWIYWCIDDKYLVDISLYHVKGILNRLEDNKLKNISSILLCRTTALRKKRIRSKNIMKINGIKFHEKKDWNAIWIHQFVRAYVLKYFFSKFPSVIPRAKDMDLLKDKIECPKHIQNLVSDKSLMLFGESTSRGKITKNCYNSLYKNNIIAPSQRISESNINIYLGKPYWNNLQMIKFLINKLFNKLSSYLRI